MKRNVFILLLYITILIKSYTVAAQDNDDFTILTKSAIWINIDNKGFSELTVLNDDHGVYNVVETTTFIIFFVGRLAEPWGLSWAKNPMDQRAIVYKKDDGKIFMFLTKYDSFVGDQNILPENESDQIIIDTMQKEKTLFDAVESME